MKHDRGSVRYHRGGWELRVSIDGQPRTRRFAGTDNRTGRRNAERALDDWLKQIGAGTDTLTVAQLLDRYIAARSPDWSPATRSTHRQCAAAITDALGSLDVAAVTVMDIETVYGQWRANGLKAATVRRRHVVLSAAMIQAERWGIIRHAPTRNVTLPKAAELPVIDLPDTSAVLAAIDLIDRPMWLPVAARLAVATGMRRGELSALRWSDIGDEHVSIHAALSMDHGVPERGSTKARRSKVQVAIDPGTSAVLAAWRRALTSRWMRAGMRPAGSDSPLFPTALDPNRALNPSEYSRQWTRNRDVIGMTGVRWHDLRHIAATEAVAGRIPSATITARFGWASIRMLDRYAHARPADDQAAADVVARADEGRY